MGNKRKPQQEGKKRAVKALDKHIGGRLKRRRVLVGLRQKDLATEAGVSSQQIQKLESGKNKLKATQLYLFSGMLGVPCAYFFEGLEPEEVGCDEDAAADVHEYEDVLMQKETLELIRAYYGVENSEMRARMQEIMRLMVESVK